MRPMIHTPAVFEMFMRQRVRASKYFVMAMPLALDSRQERVPVMMRRPSIQFVQIWMKN